MVSTRVLAVSFVPAVPWEAHTSSVTTLGHVRVNPRSTEKNVTAVLMVTLPSLQRVAGEHVLLNRSGFSDLKNIKNFTKLSYMVFAVKRQYFSFFSASATAAQRGLWDPRVT